MVWKLEKSLVTDLEKFLLLYVCNSNFHASDKSSSFSWWLFSTRFSVICVFGISIRAKAMVQTKSTIYCKFFLPIDLGIIMSLVRIQNIAYRHETLRKALYLISWWNEANALVQIYMFNCIVCTWLALWMSILLHK